MWSTAQGSMSLRPGSGILLLGNAKNRNLASHSFCTLRTRWKMAHGLVRHFSLTCSWPHFPSILNGFSLGDTCVLNSYMLVHFLFALLTSFVIESGQPPTCSAHLLPCLSHHCRLPLLNHKPKHSFLYKLLLVMIFYHSNKSYQYKRDVPVHHAQS